MNMSRSDAQGCRDLKVEDEQMKVTLRACSCLHHEVCRRCAILSWAVRLQLLQPTWGRGLRDERMDKMNKLWFISWQREGGCNSPLLRSVAWFCRSLLQTGLTCWCSSLLRRPVFSFNGTEAYRIQLLFNSLLIEKVRWVQYRRIIMRSQAWIHYFKLHRESWCLSIFV